MKEWVDAYHSLPNQSAIADAFGVTQPSVSQRLRDFAIPPRSTGWDQLWALEAVGMSEYAQWQECVPELQRNGDLRKVWWGRYAAPYQARNPEYDWQSISPLLASYLIHGSDEAAATPLFLTFDEFRSWRVSRGLPNLDPRDPPPAMDEEWRKKGILEDDFCFIWYIEDGPGWAEKMGAPPGLKEGWLRMRGLPDDLPGREELIARYSYGYESMYGVEKLYCILENYCESKTAKEFSAGFSDSKEALLFLDRTQLPWRWPLPREPVPEPQPAPTQGLLEPPTWSTLTKEEWKLRRIALLEAKPGIIERPPWSKLTSHEWERRLLIYIETNSDRSAARLAKMPRRSWRYWRETARIPAKGTPVHLKTTQAVSTDS